MYHYNRTGGYDDCGSGDNDAAAAARAVKAEQRRKEQERYINSLRHQGLYQTAGEFRRNVIDNTGIQRGCLKNSGTFIMLVMIYDEE